MSDDHVWRQVLDDLIGQINRGDLKPGDKLPTVDELRTKHKCAKMTVRRALWILEDRGLIVGQQGVGVYVAEQTDPLRSES